MHKSLNHVCHTRSQSRGIAYSMFLRAHQSVKRKKPANTKHAIFDAFLLQVRYLNRGERDDPTLVSNPQAIKAAPMKLDPRYPAGSVTDCYETRLRQLKGGKGS